MPKKQSGIEKNKYGFMLRPDINQLIEDHKHLRNSDRSSFVSEAIQRYCAELDGERNLDALCDRMYKIVSSEVDNHSDRMSSMLFKIAVEIAILNYTIGAGYVNLDDDEMQYIRNKAIRFVQKSHGVLSFEKAVEEERRLRAGNF